MKLKQQSFLEGAAVLMMAALIVKIIGACFKIPLTSILGGGGMGYFMTAYGLFNPIYALSVAGFPVAVSRMTARSLALGRQREADSILFATLAVFPAMGLLLCGIVIVSAGGFTQMVGNPGAYRAVLCIAPAVFFACVSAAFRGYFEGSRRMTPTALSQVCEAVIKLLAGIYMASACLADAKRQFENGGIVFGEMAKTLEEAMALAGPRAAAAAICGVTISTAAGSIFMMLCFFKANRERGFNPEKGFISYAPQILKCAFPVCLVALVINLTSLIDLLSVMNRLTHAAESGLDLLLSSHPKGTITQTVPHEAANFLYGCYTGLAVTVFNLVPSLTSALGISALPMISALHARGQKSQLRLAAQAVMHVTAIVAVPAGMGMFALAEPILRLLFGRNPAEVAVAVALLRTLGIAAIFVALSSPLTGMLQAVGRPYAPVKLMLLGGVAKLLINLVLVARPEVNIKGAPVGTLVCYIIITVGGMATLAKSLESPMSLTSLLLKPVIASLGCCGAATLCYDLLWKRMETNLVVLPAIALGGTIYLIFLVLLRAFPTEDVNLLLRGQKFSKPLAKDDALR